MKKLSFSLDEIKWNIQESLLTFKEEVDFSFLANEKSNDIRKISSVYVEGFFSQDGQDILCHLDITSDIVLPCVRTLVDVPYHLRVQADEVFSEAHESEDDEVIPVTEEIIDLMPFIREHILLNIPYRVYSDNPEVESGKNWSFQLEDEMDLEKKDKVDPRLQKLQQLLNQNKD